MVGGDPFRERLVAWLPIGGCEVVLSSGARACTVVGPGVPAGTLDCRQRPTGSGARNVDSCDRGIRQPPALEACLDVVFTPGAGLDGQ